ncbi:MAG: hypothetical protein COC01_01330 [Bacteroidetes bacterium]|nr:MAG: hypothetical protein COC01_01330 [Bacteroidota bacterium]
MRRNCLNIGLLILLLVFTLSSSAKLKVLATTTFIADIAENIAGDNLEIVCLMPIGGDPHIYDPTPGDAQKVVESDLVLKNGLFLEGWLNELIENAGGSRPIIEVSERIEQIASVVYHGSPDPHAWMSPINGIIYAQNITNALIQIDAQHAESYNKNFLSYKAKLTQLHEYIQISINKIPVQKRVLITSHDAFSYYGQQYGLRVESAMGTSTDAEVQISDINNLIEVIISSGVNAIFVESTINPKMMEQVATDRDIVVGGKLFADSLGDELSGASTYLDMLKQNTDVIVRALTNVPTTYAHNKESFFPLLLTVLILFTGSFLWVMNKIKSNNETDLDWESFQVNIKGLTTSYGRKTVLSNIYLKLDSGKLYGLIGPNGAGKSTLIKAILGLIPTDSGSISINNTEIDNVRKHIAYIPQKEEVDWDFPATVKDVVLMGRYPHKNRMQNLTSKDYNLSYEMIKKVGMEDYVDRQIGDLSGGQQQRIFIARALCQEAEIYFFDEPFVGVDILTEEKIIQIIKDLTLKGKTIVVIHHDLAKVKEYFDNLIMINQRLVAYGKTDQIFTDENIRKTYGGKLTLLQKTDTFVH